MQTELVLHNKGIKTKQSNKLVNMANVIFSYIPHSRELTKTNLTMNKFYLIYILNTVLSHHIVVGYITTPSALGYNQQKC